MSHSANLGLARVFLGRLAAGKSEELAALFTEDMSWEIAGDDGALPWLGKKSGRGAVVDFMRDSGEMLERLAFDVDDLLASDRRAVVLGHLKGRLRRNDAVVDSYFAIILTIADGRIHRFQMLEDSFAVSKAARHGG